ncbi:Na+/H+ antiporter subunit A [Janibacter sp. Y6]|uniref:Na+/H+ antiporter subunit A n=1 Tax=Janibacter TaxID=53457 RepID=UPI001CD8302B
MHLHDSRRPLLLPLLAAHVVLAVLAPVLIGRMGSRAFYVLALGPAATTVWALAQTDAAMRGEVTQQLTWVPALDMSVTLVMGPLQWLMTLVVAGVGALVLAYCAAYFGEGEAGRGLLAGTLVAFAGAMLGLVWADNLLITYVFWELTTVFSFLLIGFDPAKRSARAAATTALVVTTLGGLAMLVGILVLGGLSGTYSISGILASPPASSGALSAAVVLLLLGALSKSALFPFHFWLPGAMAAPTPVSAYLHAAAMVKAGVFLVALLVPAFADVPGWRELLLPLGALTMLIGGWRSLRQYDIKLLLAYGTVSQLGFLLTVLGVGSQMTAFAGMAMVLAHALFKATLFLVVGIIDKHAGTRDIRKLHGLRHRMPLVFAFAVLASMSMAGLPPLIGFIGKESIWAALLAVATEGDGTPLRGWAGWAVVVALVLGTVLTVAYTLRFLHGAFWGRGPADEDTPCTHVSPRYWAVPGVLALLSLGLGFSGAVLSEHIWPYAEQLEPALHPEELALWHGVGGPLLLSVLATLGGVLLFLGRKTFGQLQGALSFGWSAERAYGWSIRGLERAAVETTGLAQRGSVAIYLAVALVVVVAVPGTVVWTVEQGGGVIAYDTPAQLLVALVIVLAALVTTRSRRRLRAVILVSVTGYGCALLFLLHGAVDLALTQVLVETISLVVFVLVLRRLPQHFTDRPLTRTRYWRMALATAVAVVVGAILTAATMYRTQAPLTPELVAGAIDFGAGYNVVNVTLVDVRAWDTFGEISVLLVAATGVASLLFIDTRSAGIRRVADIPYPKGVKKLPSQPGRRAWLPAPRTLAPENRSILFEVVTRLIFHPMLLIGVYLLFAGHNNPGGGFAGGIVVGLALVVRYLAGGRYELDEAMPVDAGVVLGAGLFVAAISALSPLAFGGQVLQSFVLETDVPLLGHVKLVSSLFFDIGVFLVIIGLVLDLLRSLGSGIDRHIRREQRQREEEAAA